MQCFPGLFAGILLTMLCSCASKTTVTDSLKARAAPVSPFIQHPRELKPQRERAPFALVWINPDLPVKRVQYNSIYIAPVETRYLRAPRPNLSRATTVENVERPVREITSLMQQAFRRAFMESPSPRLHVTPQPVAGGVTLQLALVELNATDIVGNAVKTAVPYGGVLSPLTSGNIAIEGRVCDSATGEVLFEFADNERDQMTLVSLRDFSPFNHAKAAVGAWATQFEELTRTSASHKVKDSPLFTLDPL
ncbi:DUF3313 family protein [Verrucomicrobium spinosum]|uniref:DUF3313 family protein n=2 Tax=Verrucomicrobium spinosum TaxID=2736 RepID=UPI000174681F|nr:DUF3313 family protein [Verrucomicrobium spinosum]